VSALDYLVAARPHQRVGARLRDAAAQKCNENTVKPGSHQSVDSSAGASHVSPPLSATPQPKRLYQIREGAVVSGVANGLAAYFNIDPTIVRVAWVMAVVLEVTRADRPPMLTIGLYVLLMFIVPYAKTSEERAAAQGAAQSLPYKLQHAVERVKATFTGLHHRAH